MCYTKLIKKLRISIWNFIIFYLCNDLHAAKRIIALNQYDLLDIYLKFVTKAENISRFKSLCSNLSMDVVEHICCNCQFKFSLKFFEIFSEKFANIYFDYKSHEMLHLEGYVDVGALFINRCLNQFIYEDAIVIENERPKLQSLPKWFQRAQFLLPFALIIIMEHPKAINYEALQILMFAKETSVIRRLNENDKSELSLGLFGNESFDVEEGQFGDGYQSIILTQFIRHSSQKVIRFLDYLMVCQY